MVSDWPRFAGSRAFGVYQEDRGWHRRVTFVIDKQGLIRHVIEDEGDFPRHAREALSAVQKLAAEEVTAGSEPDESATAGCGFPIRSLPDMSRPSDDPSPSGRGRG